jgi:hypothetical protein
MTGRHDFKCYRGPSYNWTAEEKSINRAPGGAWSDFGWSRKTNHGYQTQQGWDHVSGFPAATRQELDIGVASPRGAAAGGRGAATVDVWLSSRHYHQSRIDLPRIALFSSSFNFFIIYIKKGSSFKLTACSVVWCWFVLREEYCWLVAGGWFLVREKYCWLVADKPSEQGAVNCLLRTVH